MKYSKNVWGSIFILSLFTLSFSGNGIKASSCHTDDTCFDLCGYADKIPCSYALCDDSIGVEICMTGGEKPKGICEGDYEISEELCW